MSFSLPNFVEIILLILIILHTYTELHVSDNQCQNNFLLSIWATHTIQLRISKYLASGVIRSHDKILVSRKIFMKHDDFIIEV